MVICEGRGVWLYVRVEGCGYMGEYRGVATREGYRGVCMYMREVPCMCGMVFNMFSV